MNLTEYSLKNKVVIYFLLLLVLLGGIASYFSMGKLEDSVFTIKTALVVTQYPGASAHEVEQEVTEVIERAAQSMDNIDEISSSSYAGLSIVEIDLEEKLRSKEMPQLWDVLRKKIKDAEGNLPQGAGAPNVIDDYGDVYGMFYAITGDGYSYEELNDYAQYLKQELLPVEQVGKITLFGNRIECVDVILNDAKKTELGINPGIIAQVFNSQAAIAAAGSIELNDRYIRVSGNNAFKNLDEIRNTIVQVGEEQFYLKDIADIKKSYLEPAQGLMKHNSNDAIGMAISTTKGGNVLTLAENLQPRIENIRTYLPLGIEIIPIYSEAREVEAANKVFIVNLIESVAIVVVVLLLFMGLQSGLLIGSSLIFSILGTLIMMNILDISLHRTSLAAIIIAMGMLVDNAIVVTDGALVSLQKGLNRRKAIVDISSSTSLPLLGATMIAILAFLPVFLAPNAAGEICRDLFLVLAISLSLSWFFAMTQTAITNERFLKAPKKIKDPYGSKMYLLFKGFLIKILKRRWLSLSGVIAFLIISMIAFANLKQAFFTAMEKSYFVVDYWLPEGSSVNSVENDLLLAEKGLFDQHDQIVNIITSISQTPPRYLLMAHAENYNTSFGQLLIETHSPEETDEIIPSIKNYFAEHYPQARARVKKFIAGPPIAYKVEARFIGPDPAILRDLSAQAKNIMHNTPECGDICDDWRNKVLTWAPHYSQVKAAKAGISRSDLGMSIQQLTSTGLGIGIYREHEEKLPVMLKVDPKAKNSIEAIENTGIWPQMGTQSVPLKEVVDSITVSWENSVIKRYNRQRAITVQCDPVDSDMTGATLLSKVKKQIEAIPLPPGYTLMWDGELKPSTESQQGTGTYFPMAMLLMVFIIVMLFNSVRQSLVVVAIIPLSIIGVGIGLFVTNKAFGFMAIVGFLGLIGMVLKNAIVLMDQININLHTEGMPPFPAVVNAAISRLRPVFLAAITTILGMTPIITDAMYGSMAVTIIFGLLFATILTLVVVPLLYVIFYGIKASE
ncbi:efflux RND transporter permease subunit [Carboxylicivirga sp. A043]|uniref:efflux RND transporter permease subunit n=1 Tax=Carboxylicivirga litoralis TaxID=2816963 RepID=UPI0021CB4226|nr:efflux RND transporter permease subunit [Carboxylicivirga sp. A043]MCU4157267.1 efflux RND transporter permease subunit [Carboxylicivirga sp. A043]